MHEGLLELTEKLIQTRMILSLHQNLRSYCHRWKGYQVNLFGLNAFAKMGLWQPLEELSQQLLLSYLDAVKMVP